MSRTSRYLVVFVAAVLTGRLMVTAPVSLSLVWPAAGIAAMWFTGSRSWRTRAVDAGLVTVIALGVGALTGASLTVATVLTASTVAGAAAAASVLRLLRRGDVRLATVQDGVVIGTASLACGAASAAMLVLAALLAGTVHLLPYAGLVLVRNALGCLLAGGLIAAWRSWGPAPGHRAAAAKGVGLDTVVTVAAYGVVFVAGTEQPMAYAAIPVTLWVGLRAGVLRATVHASVAGALIVALTLAGQGPFSEGPVVARFLLAQGFITVVTLTALGLSLVHAERRAATTVARATAGRLRRAIDSALIAHLTVRLAADGPVIVRANPAAAVLLGTPAASLAGRGWLDVVDATHRATVVAGLGRIRSGRSADWQAEVLLTAGDGGARWAQVSVAPMLEDRAQEHGAAEWLSVQMLDVTARKEVEERLAHMALHDALTGLANRVLLQDRVELELCAPRPPGSCVTLIFFDLDHFKTINDSLGHAAGDEVLLTMSRRLVAQARDGDTVARIGGDEFVVCCPGVGSAAEAAAVAERMLAAVAQPTTVAGHTVRLTVSAGVTVSEPGSTASALLRQSDAAMYEAKARGRGRVEHFDQELTARADRQLELDEALRVALQDRQLVMHYQPVVDMVTGTTTGLEALVRWQHPERGLLLPGEWLDVAESTDLIVELGDWAMNEAVRTAAGLVALGADLTIAVNVSARQLRDPRLVERTQHALAAAGLDPRRLILELTETHLLTVHNSLLRDLGRLRRHGVRLAVDDFGTGYSALNQLVELPIDQLKIDRSFVAAMACDVRAAAVVHGVLGMAGSLGIEVVAEGVETAEQAATLLRAGCSFGQGTLWSGAEPLENVHPHLDGAGLLPRQRGSDHAQAGPRRAARDGAAALSR